MKNNAEQQFLKELDSKLWKAADTLRNNLDAANYKHVVLGIIFLKYISDAFEENQQKIRNSFTTKYNDYYMPRKNYGSDGEYNEEIKDRLEMYDYYQEENVFWVPKLARWEFLKKAAAQTIGSVIDKDKKGNDIKLSSISRLIDDALEAIENCKIDGKLANPKLKNILPRISAYGVENRNLTELINKFSDTNFSNPVYKDKQLNLHSKDILGHVYEYFLGQFALAEGKQGGQYYTPRSIVTLIIEILEPYQGRVYDPAMGAGGFFVSSDKFIEEHSKEKYYKASDQKKNISVYGQESNPTTWKLAAMNMAIRGIDFDFGEKPADSFLEDQHPDLRADFVMANPPFNISDWWSEKLAGDRRWKYGTPPKSNANFAWMQHMLYHLAETGSMALLLANGSMSSNTNNEGVIRKTLIEKDLVECMVALPGQLFTNTQIPACIWFLTKDKKNGLALDKKKIDRCGKFLFIDARNMGFMKDRALRDFSKDDIAKITNTVHLWQRGKNYKDQKGFCYSASLADIEKHDYILTPGRYVGVAEQEKDNEPFPDKMGRLTTQLKKQMKESNQLETQIKKNLDKLGYEI